YGLRLGGLRFASRLLSWRLHRDGGRLLSLFAGRFIKWPAIRPVSFGGRTPCPRLAGLLSVPRLATAHDTAHPQSHNQQRESHGRSPRWVPVTALHSRRCCSRSRSSARAVPSSPNCASS